MGQSALGDFGDERPAAEARAVAGDGGGGDQPVVGSADRRFPEADGHVAIAVTQVDYTLAGSGRDERPVLHVFGRTDEDALEHVRVHGFRPYFYAPTGSLTDASLDRDVITGTEPGYESIRGEALTRIYARTPRDVGEIRDAFDHFEADILFPNRLLIDKGITSGVRVPARRASDGAIDVPHDELEAVDAAADLRVHTLDIEVDDRSGFPEHGEQPVVCLTSHDSYRDEYVVWHTVAPDGDGVSPDELPDHELLDGDATVEVRSFDTEAAMLAAYLDYVDETDGDVITGWNCLPADSKVLMADGSEKEIRDIEHGDEVVGTQGPRMAVADVTNKWESRKEIYKFELADGTNLRTSGEHRVMIGDDEAVAWKEAADMETGDYVVKPRELPVEDPHVPTLADLVPLERQRYAGRDTIKEFKSKLPYGAVIQLSSEFDITKDVLYHPDPTVWTPERCNAAAERFELTIPDGGTAYRQSGVELDKKLSEEELYLAGLVLTDGSMSETYGIRFYNTRKELHDQFPGDRKLTPDGKGCYKQNVLDYARMYAFHGLGIPFGNKNDQEVDLSVVYGMPKRYIASFLAGVIDGDGNVASSVSVSAANRSIGRWYVKLFRRLGIFAKQSGHTVRVPDAGRDIRRVKEHIQPRMNHSDKIAKIDGLSGGKSGQTENIPYALFEADTGTDQKRIGNDKHRRGINLKRHETSIEEWEDFVFVRIDEVTVTDTETTYDIETTTHNFFADECLVHNCDDFDAPYLIARLKRLDGRTEYDLDYNRLSRVDEVWESDWQGPNVKGRVVFDLLYGYKRTQFTELDSYRLDAVAEVELGVGKERYAGDIGDLWETDPARLLEYNLRDVELCVELDRKQEVIAFWREVATFVGCKLEDAPTAGDAVDMYVLHKAHSEFALPSKGRESSEAFEGGAVFDPITGVREMVAVLDLASLYPMAMTTVNASPETKVDPRTYDGETYVTPNGTHFRKSPDGMIREMIDDLLAEREHKKALRDEHDAGSEAYELYDRQQAAVKVIMNATYGTLGWPRFRLYDKEMSAAVTATGRAVIEFTADVVADLGYEVVYGDTDSVLLEFGPDVSTEEAIEVAFDLEDAINGRYDEFAASRLDAETHRFELEFEKLYRRFFQAGKKKRYAGHIVWKEGQSVDDIDITGFEYKRSDIAAVTKRVQREVIEMIVRGEDLDAVKAYVSEVIEEFQAGELDLDEIGIPSGIGQRLDEYDTDTAHVRGAKYANLLLGTNFQRGSKPKRLYLAKVHPEFFREFEAAHPGVEDNPLYLEFKRNPDVVCFEYADQVPAGFQVDWEKMLEKTLRGPIARVLEALDISWEEAYSGQEQTGLESYL